MPRRIPSMAAERRQSGAALLLLMLLLILGGSVLFARNFLNQSVAALRSQHNAQLMAEAREALLGYAMTWDATHPGQYGLLPCPDLDTTGTTLEGEAHTANCGAQYRNMLGRLPWRTLGLEPGRTRGGECLWYGVSGSWKSAGANSPAMLNEDSSGQLRIVAADGTTVIAGSTAGERAVAVLIAPGPPTAGQLRPTLATGVSQCGGSFVANRYLDTDTGSGIVNSVWSLLADAVDTLLAADPSSQATNDQILFITRADLEARFRARSDLQTKLRTLTQVVAKCIADYGKRNPGGASDHRLPWPAPLSLPDYRQAAQYNDTAIGALSGRVANIVNDSNAQTGNTSAGVLTACNTTTVPQWTPELATLWQHWKDHLFYAVGWSFRPNGTATATCTTCLKVNGAGAWAGVVLFAGSRLASLSQVRDEPPMNTDTRGNIANYLEGRNATNQPNAAGNGDYQSGTATATFNDIAFCLDSTLSVTAC